MKGETCSSLSTKNGYERTAIKTCLAGRHWSGIEKIIANFLGVTPHELWPDRWKAPTRKFPQGRPKYKALHEVSA